MQVSQVNHASSSADVIKPSNTLDKDSFMKIFVAQLRHQNPMSPQQDSQQMIAQITQFSILEQLHNLGDQLESLVSAGMAGTLGGMLGKEVAYLDDNGEIQKGIAQSVLFKDMEPLLVVDGIEVRPASILKIGTRED